MPKTAGAGVMLEASFPMFTTLMAISSERGTPSRSFGCWGRGAMAKTQGRCVGGKLWKIPNPECGSISLAHPRAIGHTYSEEDY